MKIVLTGATGFIGKELCLKLKEKGNSLVVLTRDIHKAKKRLGDLVVAVEWDAKTLGDWVKYVDGSDAVINLTGESIGGESIIPVPSFALKIALGEMSDLLLKGQKVIPEKLLENGYKFLFPEIEAALNNILQKN